jgi:hypothetical protein
VIFPPCVEQGAILGGLTNPNCRHCGRTRSYRKRRARDLPGARVCAGRRTPVSPRHLSAERHGSNEWVAARDRNASEVDCRKRRVDRDKEKCAQPTPDPDPALSPCVLRLSKGHSMEPWKPTHIAYFPDCFRTSEDRSEPRGLFREHGPTCSLNERRQRQKTQK